MLSMYFYSSWRSLSGLALKDRKIVTLPVVDVSLSIDCDFVKSLVLFYYYYY